MAKFILFVGRVMEISNHAMQILLNSWCNISHQSELGQYKSSLFHDRDQGERESVDDYVQELRKLFYKAYPQTMQGTTDFQDISKSILRNQFVAGLLPNIINQSGWS